MTSSWGSLCNNDTTIQTPETQSNDNKKNSQHACLQFSLITPFTSLAILSLLSQFFWSTGSVYCNTVMKILHTLWKLSLALQKMVVEAMTSVFLISHHDHYHQGGSPGPRGGSEEHLEWRILHQVWWYQLLRLETKKTKVSFLGNIISLWFTDEIYTFLQRERNVPDGDRYPPPVQFSSVAQLCPTFCDPMNCSTPGLPLHHQLLDFTQTHVHQVSDAIQPSHPLSSPSPPAPNPSQHQSLFQWVNSSHEVAKVLEFQL